MPPKILQYYECNETSNFKYDRRFHQPQGTRLANNEHATMWIERRIYRTAGQFPGILRWYEVEDTNTETLSEWIPTQQNVPLKIYQTHIVVKLKTLFCYLFFIIWFLFSRKVFSRY